ncbi:GNAT family N-acetyltransferase [Methanocella sp. MCL-LM]|uniref:GNAT family N-acetyltransferase n=1 Tax=Methanocella sp. MCL-LM TaxID=3412035 RepID=UPI003C74545F
MIIRAETADDYAGIYEVNWQAFERAAESRLVNMLRESEHYVPGLSLVAVKDGQVVGHIMFTRLAIETQDGIIESLSLAPVAVLPAFQGQGIGSKLVTEGLKACKTLGFKSVVVVGHPEYYPRFGFSSARAKGIDAPFPVPDEAFMVQELVPGALDGIRGMIRLPKEFEVGM